MLTTPSGRYQLERKRRIERKEHNAVREEEIIISQEIKELEERLKEAKKEEKRQQKEQKMRSWSRRKLRENSYWKKVRYADSRKKRNIIFKNSLVRQSIRENQ